MKKAAKKARRAKPQPRTAGVRSERSRSQLLRAALKLFSTFGYHGTSMRDIATDAKVSIGNVYHQFPDKEAIFRELLEQFWRILDDPATPLNVALYGGAFPDDLETLARAVRETVARSRQYVALIYVDVVEFDGNHIRRFYQDMAGRFQAFLDSDVGRASLDRLRPGVPPVTAVMTVVRFFFQYYSVELLFGVPNHFGVDDETALQQTVDVLKSGILKSPDRNPRQAS